MLGSRAQSLSLLRKPRRRRGQIRIDKVEHAEAPILHPGHRFDADEAIAELLSEVAKAPELGPGVRQIVAMWVDDGRSEGSVCAARHDDEVGLERRPLSIVILVGDAQRCRRRASRVPYQATKPGRSISASTTGAPNR